MDIDELELKLNLKYTNESTQNLILWKGMPIVKVAVYRSDEPAQADFELELDRISMNRSGLPSRPNEYFVILKPGESVSNISSVNIFVRKTDKQPLGVRSGTDGMLQVEISPRWGRAAAMKAQSDWADLGRLWVDQLLSEPYRIQIQKEPATRPCPFSQ